MNDTHPNAPGNNRPYEDEFGGAPISQQAQTVRSGQIQGPLDSFNEASLAADLERASLNEAIATAHRFPRKLDVVLSRIEQTALFNEASAERCVYSLPRGGKAILGPSITFANLIASAWGNCRDGGRWVKTERGDKVVVCEGIFLDLETNRQTVRQITRRISDRNGRIYNDDMIAVTAQAGVSIAVRNAIIHGVPRAIWYPIYERAQIIMRGTLETLPERREKMVQSFAAFGVAPEKVLGALGVSAIKDITLEHLIVLRGFYQALRDEATTPDELFDPRRMTGGGFDQVANPLGQDDEDAPADTGAKAATGNPQEGGQPQGGTGGAHPAEGQPAASSEPANGNSGDKRGRGRPALSEEEKAARAQARADAKAQADAQAAKEKADREAEAQAKQAAAAAAAASAAAQQEQQQTGLPKTPEEYIEHLRDAAEAAAAKKMALSEWDHHWRSERDLRTTCRVTEEHYTQAQEIHQATRKALGA